MVGKDWRKMEKAGEFPPQKIFLMDEGGRMRFGGKFVGRCPATFLALANIRNINSIIIGIKLGAAKNPAGGSLQTAGKERKKIKKNR